MPPTFCVAFGLPRRLTALPVRQALAALAGPDIEVGAVKPLGRPAAAGQRGHARELFAVQLQDTRTGEVPRRQIVAEGACLGYFGRQSIAQLKPMPAKAKSRTSSVRNQRRNDHAKKNNPRRPRTAPVSAWD